MEGVGRETDREGVTWDGEWQRGLFKEGWHQIPSHLHNRSLRPTSAAMAGMSWPQDSYPEEEA